MSAIMREISRVVPTAGPITTKSASSQGVRSGRCRRVMRAAWALHRDSKCSFQEALRAAWSHEKVQCSPNYSVDLTGVANRFAYLGKALETISGIYPVEDYRNFHGSARDRLSHIIEMLVDVLDLMDGDADDEEGADDEYDNRSLSPSTATSIDRVIIT